MAIQHGTVDTETATGLVRLRERITAAAIPPSELEQKINIATWNIREFGRKPRLKASIHFIAEILNQFDLIAVTEVRQNVNDLKRVMDLLGHHWRVIFCDTVPADRAGNKERMAYVFDERQVTFTGLAAEADPTRKKKDGKYVSPYTWWRSPYIASFRAGNFDFVVVAAHIRWGKNEAERLAPVKALGEWIKKRHNAGIDQDIVLMGDFNIPSDDSPLLQALRDAGLTQPQGLAGSGYTTNFAQNAPFDQILYFQRSTQSFTGKAGVIDLFLGDGLQRFYPGSTLTEKKLTYQLSDHLPLWAQLDVDVDDEKLDQVLGSL